MARVEFSKATKLAAWRRAMGRCEGCSGLLMEGKFHYDHRNPSEFSGDASVENCQVLCIGCHGAKTALKDAPAIAKSTRIRNRAIGIRKERKILAWRNFAGEIVRKPKRRDRE
jgi:5-methylcytosine-specific restriction endonuclease McrA